MQKYLLNIIIVLTSPLQFGSHMAILNAPMDFMGCNGVENPSFHCIENWNPDLPSSVYAVGGLIGSAFASMFMSKFGLYGSLSAAAATFPIGSLVFWSSRYQSTIVVSRIITGIGAGMSIVVAPIAIHKSSPPHLRGLFGAQTQISTNVGICLAQICGIFWAETQWTKIAFFAALVGLLSFGSIVYLQLSKPENSVPRNAYAEINDRPTDTDLSGTSPARAALSIPDSFTLRPYHYALGVAVAIFLIQQLTGINAIILYGVHILADVIPSMSKQINLGISIVNLGVTMASAFFIDSFGRKKLLVTSSAFVGVCSAMFAFALVRGSQTSSAAAAVLFVASFAIGTGPIPFSYISEIAPPEAVNAAQSVGMVSSWLSTFGVLASFPKSQDAFGPSSFYVFSICTSASAGLSHYFLRSDRPATTSTASSF